MKKIINKPMDVVSESLQGMELAHPELEYTPGAEVISRREKGDKVAVISGGGAGHEPAHAGYVGKGMLDTGSARPSRKWMQGKACCWLLRTIRGIS